jgi:cytochrome c
MKPFVARILDPFLPVAMVFAVGALGLTHALPAHADAAAGKTAFNACSACHSVNGSDGIGPPLNGVVGRKAGAAAGFTYSPALKRANITWDAGNLDRYLADPQKAIPGNRMPFSGMPDASARADIVAYLGTLH